MSSISRLPVPCRVYPGPLLLFPLFRPCFTGLTPSAAVAPVRVKGHAGQVLAMAFAEPFNVLITSGEKDRTVRCV